MKISNLYAMLFALLVAHAATAAPRGEIYDRLDLPALPSERAVGARLFGIALAGERLVAVGMRGFILYSDDAGASWSQAQVPVRSTLLDVYFVTPEKGWAVGHDGVVLHSADAGETWVKQLDGYQAAEIGLAQYRERAAAEPDNEAMALLASEFEFAIEQGADRPFFFTWFQTEQIGWAIGSYGLAMVTFDGGQKWQATMDLAENWNFQHIFDYYVNPRDGMRYMSGELGMVLVQDEMQARVRSVIPFYDGSFYTIAGNHADVLVTAGLRGNTFRSVDEATTWQRVELDTQATIAGSTTLADGRIVLVSQAGEVLLGNADATAFTSVPLQSGQRYPFSDVVEVSPGQLALVGTRGVQTITLN